MKTIPNFEKFDVNETVTAVGFGMNGINNYGLGGGTPQTGYSMGAIAGVVESCSNHVAEQAKMYESNDNDNHTAEAYMKEAKKHINESMDRAYEGYGSMDEAMVQIKGKDKPSGAKVLAKLIVGEFYDQKKISSREVKEWENDITQLIINSTF
jgi:hypothetical protein|tara:strand:- start:1106 stop:1564 length:459 start_codon:yes stop_codon:yes gene_type:complete